MRMRRSTGADQTEDTRLQRRGFSGKDTDLSFAMGSSAHICLPRQIFDGTLDIGDASGEDHPSIDASSPPSGHDGSIHQLMNQQGVGQPANSRRTATPTSPGQGKAAYIPLVSPSPSSAISSNDGVNIDVNIRADRWKQSEADKYGCNRRSCKPLRQKAVATWNVQGLGKDHIKLTEIQHHIETKGTGILCMQETHVAESMHYLRDGYLVILSGARE